MIEFRTTGEGGAGIVGKSLESLQRAKAAFFSKWERNPTVEEQTIWERMNRRVEHYRLRFIDENTRLRKHIAQLEAKLAERREESVAIRKILGVHKEEDRSMNDIYHPHQLAVIDGLKGNTGLMHGMAVIGDGHQWLAGMDENIAQVREALQKAPDEFVSETKTNGAAVQALMDRRTE